MNKKSTMLLMSLLISFEVRPIDPVTICIGTGVAYGMLRTTIGKMVLGAFLMKASQTSMGKQLVGWSKKRLSSGVQSRFALSWDPLKIQSYSLSKELSKSLCNFQNFVMIKRQQANDLYIRHMNSGSITVEQYTDSSCLTRAAKNQRASQTDSTAFTQNINTATQIKVENSGFFAKAYVYNGDPVKAKEHAQAVAHIAVANERGWKNFWMGTAFGGGSVLWLTRHKSNSAEILTKHETVKSVEKVAS